MKKIILVVLLSAMSLVGCTKQTSNLITANDIADNQIISIKVGETPLSVEAVTSIESITKGLGERDQIGSDGMLFFMPERREANFWMHGMRFPLDMIWIDENKIVGIEKNVPAPEDPSSFSLPSYSSKVPVTHVLELPAGKSDELKLVSGMEISN